jgi:hypothetical protein
MKCVIDSEPPCSRCRRANRQCRLRERQLPLVKRSRLTSAGPLPALDLTAAAGTKAADVLPRIPEFQASRMQGSATSDGGGLNEQTNERDSTPGAEKLQNSNLVSPSLDEAASTSSNDLRPDLLSLPSIYSFSPVNAVKNSSRADLSPELVDTGASTGTCSQTQQTGTVSGVQANYDAPVSDRILKQLMDMYAIFPSVWWLRITNNKKFQRKNDRV